MQTIQLDLIQWSRNLVNDPEMLNKKANKSIIENKVCNLKNLISNVKQKNF